MTEITQPDEAVLPTDRYLDREQSWLDFNNRVLDLAKDAGRIPLIERAKFLAIFSSPLDEFFMVRVAGLKRRIAAGVAVPTVRYHVTSRPDISAPGSEEPVRRQVKVEMNPTAVKTGRKFRPTIVDSGTSDGLVASGLISSPVSQRWPYWMASRRAKPRTRAMTVTA